MSSALAGFPMSTSSQWSASPVLIGNDSIGRSLERVPLSPQGKGAFDEAWLQNLVHQNASCLPISEIEPSLGVFFPICREMLTPRGAVDNLLMTGAGDIAIVETKLYRNPQARREVLAQILDYATALFAMDYTNFEKCVLSGEFSPSQKPKSLYEALPEGEKLEEKQFIDSVARNLRLGRAILIIAGDGIRSEAEQLLAGMQTHARFGFTLALVELAVFKMPNTPQFIVQPRILAKTEIVQRTVVELIGGVPTIREERPVVPENIGVSTYWETLEAKTPGAKAALERLIKAVEPFGVYPEFLKTLNFKWARPGKKPVNLGYIATYNSIWTDASAWFAPKELAHEYVQDIANTFGCQCQVLPTSGYWMPYQNGKPLKLGSVLKHLEDWAGPMQRFVAAIEKHDKMENDNDT